MDLASVLTLALLAVFLAVQPWSVLAAVLFATARGGMRKELAFVGGWVTALAAVAVATVLVYPAVPRSSSASRGQAAVELAAGLVLGGWLSDPLAASEGPGHQQPTLVDGPPGRHVAVAGVRPRRVPADVCRGRCGGLRDAVQRAHPGRVVGRRCCVGVLASAGVASPLMVLVVDRDHAPETYQRWRSWIVGHSRAVLYGVGALVCLVLVGKGIAGLVG